MSAAVIALHKARPTTDVAPALVAGLKAMHDVAQKLERNGFSVIGAFFTTRPELTVQRHRLIDQLIQENQAAYFYHSQNERRGEFFGEGNDGTKVRIIWIEKVNA